MLYKAADLPSIVQRIENTPAEKRTPKEAALLTLFPQSSIYKNRPQWYVLVKEKGGKWRLAPVIGAPEDIRNVVDRFKLTPPGKKVWQHIPRAADIHAYRADYAITLYKLYARDVAELKGKEIYACRGDQKGKHLDRRAMEVVEKALGHEKPHTFAAHYAYKV